MLTKHLLINLMKYFVFQGRPLETLDTKNLCMHKNILTLFFYPESGFSGLSQGGTDSVLHLKS